LLQSGTGGLTADLVHARELYRRACDGGELRGCNSLGYMLEHALGTPAPPPPVAGHRAPPVPTADFAGAARLYERACDGGLMRGCNNLAALYLRGVGVPDGANPVRARELFMRACEGQNGLGCSNLGQLYELGTGISADVVRASQLYERACELGAGAGCYRLALLYDAGRGCGRRRRSRAPAPRRRLHARIRASLPASSALKTRPR